MPSDAYQVACDPLFCQMLTSFDSILVNSEVVSVCGIWPDFRIAYLSRGWYRFAAENGGEPAISQRWQLGSDLLSGIQGPLRGYFRRRYEQCIDRYRSWQHSYECSSVEVYRLFHQIAYPLPEKKGLLIVHSVHVERPHAHDGVAARPAEEIYRDANGIICQCSYCRRVRQVAQPEVWDWVPAWVANSAPNTSHGICESCYGYYEPRLKQSLDFPTPLRTSEL